MMNILPNKTLKSKEALFTRLASYRKLKNNFRNSIYLSKFASAGYVYSGDISNVLCQGCGYKLDQLNNDVNPKNASYHRAGCMFVNTCDSSEDENDVENSYNAIETDGFDDLHEHIESRESEAFVADKFQDGQPVQEHGYVNREDYIQQPSTTLTNENSVYSNIIYSPLPAPFNKHSSEGSPTLFQSSSLLESTQSRVNVPLLTRLSALSPLTSPDIVSDYSSDCSDTHFYDDEYFDVECDKSENRRKVAVHRIDCNKNPGHYAYFSPTSITPEQIPSSVRNEMFLTFIKLIAFLTVRIHVTYTSLSRPQEDVSGKTGHREGRYGTGFVFEDPSLDDEAETDGSPEPPRSPKFHVFKKFMPFLKRSKSGHIYVNTNRHLVFDKEEALHSTVDFFYDSPDGKNVVSVKGDFVLFNPHPGNNQVVLVCRCTDSNLIKQLGQTKQRLLEVAEQLPSRTKQCLTKKLFIIHHPHGGEKVLSYGDSVLVKFALRPSGAEAAGNSSLKLFKITSQTEVPADVSMHRKALLYAADTCQGSSGAPVIFFRKEDHGQDTTVHYILDIWMHNGVDKVHKLGASVLKVCSFSDFVSSSRPGQIVGQPSSSNETAGSDSDEEEGQGSEHVTSPVFKVLTHPSYPAYIAYQKRKESYSNWNYKILSPEILALAGFFYAGYADCVRCFQCGLGLRSWKEGDDVYTEHTKHRPNCPYLQIQIRLGLVHGAHALDKMISASIGNVSTFEEEGENVNTRESHAVNQDPEIISIDSGVGSGKYVNGEPEGHLVLNLVKKENSKLREQLTCKVCFRAAVKDLFLPCGELYACTECSKLLTHCPSCNKQILATVTVYFT